MLPRAEVAIDGDRVTAVGAVGERGRRENSVAEMAWMESVSRASGRPLMFAITQSDRRPGLWSWVMDETAAARSRGADSCSRPARRATT